MTQQEKGKTKCLLDFYK